MMPETKQYPLLTIELLIGLDKKVDAMKTTKEDCELIDHYLTSIGKPGYLKTLLMIKGVLSYDDIKEALQENPNDPFDANPDGITGYLQGCIDMLRGRVLAGEKIY